MPGFLNVILDIDETFLHHIDKGTWESEVPKELREEFDTKPDASGESVFVFRPHLKKFMEFLVNNCKTVNIWTWNSEAYAQEVKTMMEEKFADLGLKFTNVWSADAADAANDEYGGHKTLQWLWDQGIFTKSDTLLIDEHPNMLATYKKKNKRGKDVVHAAMNSKNAFNISAFEPEEDPESAIDDDGLLQAIEEIEKILAGKSFCRAYARMPKTGGRKTLRKGRKNRNRRKTKTRR